MINIVVSYKYPDEPEKSREIASDLKNMVEVRQVLYQSKNHINDFMNPGYGLQVINTKYPDKALINVFYAPHHKRLICNVRRKDGYYNTYDLYSYLQYLIRHERISAIRKRRKMEREEEKKKRRGY